MACGGWNAACRDGREKRCWPAGVLTIVIAKGEISISSVASKNKCTANFSLEGMLKGVPGFSWLFICRFRKQWPLQCAVVLFLLTQSSVAI